MEQSDDGPRRQAQHISEQQSTRTRPLARWRRALRLMCAPDKQPRPPFMWRDAAWQCEGYRHLAEQFPLTAWVSCFISPEEIIS